MSKQYIIGLDFGTDSVRSLMVDASNGEAIGSKVHWYKRWKEGLYCDPSSNQFRQHSLDHIEGMEIVIRDVVIEADIDPKTVMGICVDTTGSSPQPIDRQGSPLCLNKGFEENPNAMTILWKDHTAIAEADEINNLARNWGGVDYTKFEGGIYSSEWFWAKILHISRVDEKVKNAAYSWMEHCDLMTYVLVGSPPLSSFPRSRCAAGHKAMWHENWGGLPYDDFLTRLDPYLVEVKNHLYEDTFTSDQIAGNLSSVWAQKLGLTVETIVAVGTFDAHAGAVGAEVEEYTLVRVMGTSTCDIIVSPDAVIGQRTVRGICGQVDGSVIPGMIGLEAGQSAFGDVLAWFRDILISPTDDLIRASNSIDAHLKEKLISEIKVNLIAKLSELAESTPLGESAPLALDWVNGRRTPDADQNLKAAIINLNLGTKAPHIFRALVEAICFGSKKIIDRFEEEGVKIKVVVGIGGVAKKSPFVMQTLADVLNRPIKIAVSDQAPALGAAMYAATAARIYNSVEDAKQAMGQGFEATYMPDPYNTKIYQKIYADYQNLGEFVEFKI
jgi:L-ribulokinase